MLSLPLSFRLLTSSASRSRSWSRPLFSDVCAVDTREASKKREMPHRCDSSDGLESLVDDFDGLAINNNRGGGGGRFNGSYRPDKIYINDKKEAQMATRLLCSRPQDFLPSLDRGTRKLAAMQALLLEFGRQDRLLSSQRDRELTFSAESVLQISSISERCRGRQAGPRSSSRPTCTSAQASSTTGSAAASTRSRWCAAAPIASSAPLKLTVATHTAAQFASQQAVRQHLSDMRKNQQKWGQCVLALCQAE